MTKTLKKKIIFFAEDPGGANYLKPLISLFLRKYSVKIVAKGHSAREFLSLYKNFLLSDKTIPEIFDAQKPDIIICGSADNPVSIDKLAIVEARKRKILSVGVIDFWTGCESRYSNKKADSLYYAPDYLLVIDTTIMEKFVQLGFPKERIFVCGHPHFDEILSKKREMEKQGKAYFRRKYFPDVTKNEKIILFSGEPLWYGEKFQKNSQYSLTGYKNSSERIHVALDEFLSSIKRVNMEAKVIIRMHPKNSDSDYAKYKNRVWQVTKYGNSVEMLFSCDAVVGVCSMFLLEAVIIGKPVLSIMPKREEVGCLPSNLTLSSYYASTPKEIDSSLIQIERIIKGEKNPLNIFPMKTGAISAAENTIEKLINESTKNPKAEIKLSLSEKLTTQVYGKTFAIYQKKDYADFLSPFKKRFTENKLDFNIFRGKKCLDAGCGGGRGSMFMALNGAAEIHVADISKLNINTTTKWAHHYGYKNISVYNMSLENLPFENESFDFVWCNGVIHHTDNPAACLSEISRVLKKDGYMWLYLYGSGGLYWELVDVIRGEFSSAEIDQVISLLLFSGYEVGRIAEFIDDWFVPHLRRYIHGDIKPALLSLGFDPSSITPLPLGCHYDTNHRNNIFREKAIWGGGDLRYLLRKRDLPDNPKIILPNVNKIGSVYHNSPETRRITAKYGKLFKTARNISSKYTKLGKLPFIINLAAYLQFDLRNKMSLNAKFDLDDYERSLDGILEKANLYTAKRI
jgi:ubiquinone/menaquinone biosynthesis C-methylase UbiE